MSDGPQGVREFQVRIDDETAVGAYSNLQIVQHTETEFVIDFVFAQPTVPAAKVHTRVVLSPKHAKALAATIAHNVGMYERVFGEITPPAQPPVPSGPAGPQGPQGLH